MSKIFLPVILLLASMTDCFSQKGEWTHFRGNNLNGIATVGQAPLQWDESSHIKWKTAVHGRGWSSPVVLGNQVWLTTATADGRELFAMCFDLETGKIMHDIKVFTPETSLPKHAVNTYATPTPAIEDGFVYVHYGTMGTACINTADGRVVWTRTDIHCDHIQGPGSSVMLYKDLVILHYEGVDVRFLIALDKRSGKTVWQTNRQEEPYKRIPWVETKAYVTPLLVNVKGRDLIISNGSAIANAFDPNTGEEVWGLAGGAGSTIAMPFEENGIVFFETGYFLTENRTRVSEMYAVNPDGSGDIFNTNVLWSIYVAPMPLSTPVIKDGLIYAGESNRTLRCIDASDGKEVWSYKLSSTINSSPVYAAGRIYFSTTAGQTLVVRAGREFNLLSENKLDGEIWATPAFVGNSILMRTDSYLYRIE